jgi:hypothetical protein
MQGRLKEEWQVERKQKITKNDKHAERKIHKSRSHKWIINTDNRMRKFNAANTKSCHYSLNWFPFHSHYTSLVMVSSHLLLALKSGSFPNCFSTNVQNAFLAFPFNHIAQPIRTS